MGMNFVSYNIHSLIHIAQDARKFGPLDNVSAFPFETFLGTMKKLVRRPQNPVQQIVRRIHERQKVSNPNNISVSSPLIQLHFSGPLLESMGTYEQYRRYDDGQTVISSKTGNDCFSVGGRVVLVRNILSPAGTVKVLCSCFENAESFFSYPLDSERLGILFVFNLSKDFQIIPVEELKTKMVLLPFKTGYVALPLLH